MNILYLHTHDLGRYAGPYGYPPRMPNLQRLAYEGTLFRNAFCAAPTCSPSRASLLAGIYPHQCGMYGLTGGGWFINEPDHHLAAFLSQNGYSTVLTGVQHVAPPGVEANQAMGYTQILMEEEESVATERELTTETTEAFLASSPQQPFFLDVGYVVTHHSHWDRSFVVSHPVLGDLDWRYVRPLPHLPDTPATRWEAAMQFRAAEYLDIQIGRVLDALDASGLAQDTVVIFTTDHGPGLPGVKMNLNDRGTGVALIIRGPGFGAGQVSEDLVSHLDLYPTLCELIGVSAPPWLEGQSLLSHTPRSEVFAEQNYHGSCRPLRSVRTERYRYIRRLGPECNVLQYACDGGEAKAYLNDHGQSEIIVPEEQLYDLAFDPNEAVNVAEHPRYAVVLQGMRERLDVWAARTNDGPVPEPHPRPEWFEPYKNRRRMEQDDWQERREKIQGISGLRSR